MRLQADPCRRRRKTEGHRADTSSLHGPIRSHPGRNRHRAPILLAYECSTSRMHKKLPGSLERSRLWNRQNSGQQEPRFGNLDRFGPCRKRTARTVSDSRQGSPHRSRFLCATARPILSIGPAKSWELPDLSRYLREDVVRRRTDRRSPCCWMRTPPPSRLRQA